MRIAARIAMNSPLESGGPDHATGYHGRDIVLHHLSTNGFEAECHWPCPEGALVRLKLPCAGIAMARIVEARGSMLRADFVNPVSMARLAKVLGAPDSMKVMAAA